MTISWKEIEYSIEDSIDSENAQEFYNFIIRIIKKNQLTCIDEIEKLKLLLMSLPPENKYEIFELFQMQPILNNFNAKEIVELYGLFLPEDAYKFFKSDFIKDRLKSIFTSEIDCEDILSYFPYQNGIRDSLRDLFNTHLIHRQERNNLELEDEGYDSNEDNSTRRFRI